MSSTWFLLDTAHGLEGSGVFQLNSLPGLKIGFQADMTGDDLTLNGANIINLGHSEVVQFTQGVDAKRYELIADRGDGLPTIRASGVDDFMQSASDLELSHDLTVVTVFKPDIAATDSIIGHSTNPFTGNSGFELTTDPNPRSSFNGAFLTRKDLDSGTITAGEWVLLLQECDTTNVGHLVFKNGSPATIDSNPNTANPGAGTTTDPLFLGSRAGTVSFFDGDYSAGAVYDPRLSPTNRAALMAGLARWVI